MRVAAPAIITCPQWQARRPNGRILAAGRPDKVVIHHTDGHAPALPAPGKMQREQAAAYAKQLQNDMIDRRGWIDSGHNFLVLRSGLIVQGRWGTVTAIEHGRMVVSAHCPGQNDQPGIEHEHLPGEPLTAAQLAASGALIAWICSRTGIRPTELYGHDHFYATDCPDNLRGTIPTLRLLVARLLTQAGPQRRARAAPLLGARVRRAA